VATIKHHRDVASRITPEAIQLFRWAKAIWEDDGDLEWEEDGGRRREFLTTSGMLHDELGLQLWDLPVLSESVENDPVSWPWRRALDEAAMAEEAAGRPLVRPNGLGLDDTQEALKRISESPARSRVG
jgi:hypothetical protein